MARQTVNRAFKYRFYPTNAQTVELSRTFGCVHLVYNQALAARTQAWYQHQERVNCNATSAMLTSWKKEDDLIFLTEASSAPLQQMLNHLQGTFSNFFAGRARYPRFKSRKKARVSAEYTPSAFRYRDGQLFLAKMSDPLNIVWSRPLPEGAIPSTVTVSRDNAGRWFVSLLCGDTIETAPAPNQAVGVDAGITCLVSLSTGEKVTNRTLSRAISGTAWRQMRTMLGYKASWYGRELVVVDRFFPSSKPCSTPGCGHVNQRMPLNVREWTCPRCGTVHDRDVNAANNPKAAGLAASACGAGVRPQRESSRTGRSASKQEGHRATRDGAKAPNHR